jgi:hypothetical protein
MSAYEQTAWDATLHRLNRRRNNKARKTVGIATTPVKNLVGGAWHKVPIHEGVEQQMMMLLGGM